MSTSDEDRKMVFRYKKCLPPFFQAAVSQNNRFFIHEAAKLLKSCACRLPVYACIFDEECETFECTYKCKCVDSDTLGILLNVFGDPGVVIMEFIGHRCHYCFTNQTCCPNCRRKQGICTMSRLEYLI